MRINFKSLTPYGQGVVKKLQRENEELKKRIKELEELLNDPYHGQPNFNIKEVAKFAKKHDFKTKFSL